MAKKKTSLESYRPQIFSPYFSGYVDEMPEEAKGKLRVEKPKLYERLFGTETEIAKTVISE